MIVKNKKLLLNMLCKMSIVSVVIFSLSLFACKSSRMSNQTGQTSVMEKAILYQTMTENDNDEIILFGTPEESAMFNDKPWYEEFRIYIASNTIYPEETWKDGISGRVFVEFLINVDGTLTDVKVIHSAHSLLDAEALRVINSSPPHWTSAKNRGKPVKQKLLFPFTFSIPVEK